MNPIEITPELLADLKAKAQKATPGPWALEEWSGPGTITHVKQRAKHELIAKNGASVASYAHEPSASYIAAADPSTILALIEDYENKREALRGMFQLVDQLKACMNLEADAGVEETIKAVIGQIRRLEEDFDAAARSAADESVKAVKLEEEANWLANTLADKDCPHGCPSEEAPALEECLQCWRKVAQEAIAEEEARIKDSEPDA